MNIIDDIKPVTYLKSRAEDLLNQINETHRPVIITQNGEPRAVLQDPENYENMRDAIGILILISQGETDVRNGRTKPQESVFNEIESELKAIDSRQNVEDILLNRFCTLNLQPERNTP